MLSKFVDVDDQSILTVTVREYDMNTKYSWIFNLRIVLEKLTSHY